MYLSTVLSDIQKESAPPKALNAEHLYKLNEAIFNLPEEDHIDNKMSTKLFQAITKIRKAYNNGNYLDADHNFFYDYVALLGTLQNQHFFSGKQTDEMLAWVKEAIDDGSSAAPAPKASAQKEAAASKAEEKKLKKLGEDNKKLKEELEKLASLSDAVGVLKNFKPEVVEALGASKPKSKGRGRGKSAEDVAPEGGKSRARGKAKAKPAAKGKEGGGKKWKAKESADGEE